MIDNFDYASLYPSLMKSIKLKTIFQNHLGIEIERDYISEAKSGPANHVIVSSAIAEILNKIKI